MLYKVHLMYSNTDGVTFLQSQTGSKGYILNLALAECDTIFGS